MPDDVQKYVSFVGALTWNYHEEDAGSWGDSQIDRGIYPRRPVVPNCCSNRRSHDGRLRYSGRGGPRRMAVRRATASARVHGIRRSSITCSYTNEVGRSGRLHFERRRLSRVSSYVASGSANYESKRLSCLAPSSLWSSHSMCGPLSPAPFFTPTHPVVVLGTCVAICERYACVTENAIRAGSFHRWRSLSWCDGFEMLYRFTGVGNDLSGRSQLALRRRRLRAMD